MFVLIASLVLGYVGLTKGPALFAAVIAAASIAFLRKQIDGVSAALLELRSKATSRHFDGKGWDTERDEQKLLARSLRLALQQTSLISQYPLSAVRAYK